MTNLALYKQVVALKNFLEINSLEEVSKKRIEKSVSLVNEIFSTLERRKGTR